MITVSKLDPLADAAEREHIRTDLDRTMFVEAGAGSGKTTLLVDRIANLVLEADVPLGSIAAITFTEAAASELASRIRTRFETVQAAAQDRGDLRRTERCRQAIADTDLAAITTLHGFASRILGEFAVSAQLPPRVHVLDEVSSQLAHEERWQRFVDRLYDDEKHQQLLVLASALDVAIERRYAAQTTLRDVAAEFNQNWDRLDALIDDTRAAMAEPSFEHFDRAVDEVAAWPAACTDPGDRLLEHLERVIPEMRALQQLVDPVRKLRQMMILSRNGGWGRGRGGRKESWPSKPSEIKDSIGAVNEAIDRTIEPVVDAVLTRLCDLIARETVDSARERRAGGGLEFHDLLVLARNMLRTNRAARQILHERYRHILLDEFQDTDPIQIELAVLIATDAPDIDDRAWHELPVAEGRLFFVGDPKQSIYRFRRADIALFLRARDRFAGSHGPTRLSMNFRSAEAIVAWVNAFFAVQMPEERPLRQPRYEPLQADRLPPDAAERHRPVLLGGPHPDPKVSAGELRSAEADDVVAAVRSILDDPDAWPVFDTVTESWRAGALDDITILLPTRTSLPFLRAALDDAHIRYRIATGTLVYDTQEVRDALAALRAIDDPGDELSLIATLRSPLYACTDVDLLRWRRSGGRWDYRRPTNPDRDDPVARAFEHLHSLWTERWFMTPSALLDRLIRERRAAMLALGNRRPTDIWRRLRFLVEQARAFEEAGSGDLRAFIDWAALQGGSMARVHEPLLPETDEDALDIQTIHGAKGLEFPIAILSGMTTQLGQQRPGVSVLWPDVGAPSVRIRRGLETRHHEPRADLEAEMDQYERWRLAYVATTRARDHLLVSCHHKVGVAEKTYGGRFWQIFDDSDRGSLTRRLVTTAGEPADEAPPSQLGLPLDDRRSWIQEREALLAPFRESRVWSATRVARAAVSGADLVEQDDDEADLGIDPVAPGRRRGRIGSAIGSAVHAVLHLVDLTAPSDVATLVGEQCEIESIPGEAATVAQLVHSALQSSAVALAAEHLHHKELFVAAPLDERTIEGYVDLLIETPDGLVVVDYKTDTVRTEADVEAKLDAYEVQAATYAVALEVSTGRPVTECRFVFCRNGAAIERTVSDLGAAKARVRTTIAAGTTVQLE